MKKGHDWNKKFDEGCKRCLACRTICMSGFIPDRFAQHGGSPVDPSLPDPSEIVPAVAWQYDPISVPYGMLIT